jgi:flagellar biosynthetic protein FliR
MLGLDLTNAEIYSFFLVFCRISMVFMLIPGIGESYILARTRLLAALTVALLVVPTVQQTLPTLPENVFIMAAEVTKEVTTGLFMGLLIRILASVMHTAGMVIAYQSGLAAAMMFDPSSDSQGSTTGNFLVLVSVVLLMVTDFHHLVLRALVDSYTLFAPSAPFMIGDMTELVTQTFAQMFSMAIKLAAPHVVIGLLVSMTAGMMARVMPSMQVFFVVMPAQILLSFVLLALTFSAGMMWYLDQMHELMGKFIAYGR